MIVIQYGKINEDTPAKIYPGKRVIVIDPQKFCRIPSFYMRMFILCHELAHLYTTSETAADLIAFSIYSKSGYPLRDAFFALTRCLKPTIAHKRVSLFLKQLLRQYG